MHKTDRTLFKKGIKFLLIALPLLVLAPVLITVARLNKETFIFWVIFIPGMLAFVAAMYMIYKGVNTLMEAFFSKKESDS